MSKFFNVYTRVTLLLLWIAAVFDPIGDLFAIRYIALANALLCVLVVFAFWFKTSIRFTFRELFIIYAAILMPLYALVLCNMRGGASNFTDTSYIAAGILLIPAFLHRNQILCNAGVAAMIFSLRSLAILILFIFFSGYLNFNLEWADIFTKNNVALISMREYSGIQFPYIYFFSSPMLIYLTAFEVDRFVKRRDLWSLILCIISLLSLGLSGTRAHLLIAVLFVPVYFIFLYSRYSIFWCLAGFFSLFVLFVVVDIEVLRAFLSTNETSNAMKIEMLYGYARIFDDPITFFFGQGYNAHMWSWDLRGMVSLEEGATKTELTYLELFRVYGVFVTMPFLILLAMLAKRLSVLPAKYRWLYPAFVVYLINSAINPYLFSTNGILFLGLALSVVTFSTKSRSVCL